MIYILIKKAEEMGIFVSPDAETLFSEYTDLLLKYNEVMNLTAITDRDEILVKHYLDSLSPLAFSLIEDKKSVVDVGTGAGFPGLPLKIGKRDISLTLIDSLKKRVEFLKTVAKELSLEGVSAIHGRAEEKGHDETLREQFDYAVSRAVAPLSILAEYCLPFVKVGGSFLALKGPAPEEEIEDGKKAIETLGGKIEKIYHVKLPGDIIHSIVLIKKISHTPPSYPRKPGKPSKSPIK